MVHSHLGRLSVSFAPAFRAYSALLDAWVWREQVTGAPQVAAALVGAVLRMAPVLAALGDVAAPQRTQLASDYTCVFRRADVVRVVYRRQYGVDVHARAGFAVLSGAAALARRAGRARALTALPDAFYAQPGRTRALPGSGGRAVLVAEPRALLPLLRDAQRWACKEYALRTLPAVLAAEVRDAAGRAPAVRGDTLQFAAAGGVLRHARVDPARTLLQLQDVTTTATSTGAAGPSATRGTGAGTGATIATAAVAVPLEHFVLFPLRAGALRLVARLALLPLRVAAELVAVARLVQQQQQQLQQREPPARPRAAVVWCQDAAQAPAALRPHYAPCALALAPDALDVLVVVLSRETGHETQLFIPLRYSYDRRAAAVPADAVLLLESLVPAPTLDQCRTVVAHARATAAAAAAAAPPQQQAQAPGALQVFVSALISAMSDTAFLQSLAPTPPLR